MISAMRQDAILKYTAVIGLLYAVTTHGIWSRFKALKMCFTSIAIPVLVSY